jgi:hypothetical protein
MEPADKILEPGGIIFYPATTISHAACLSYNLNELEDEGLCVRFYFQIRPVQDW